MSHPDQSEQVKSLIQEMYQQSGGRHFWFDLQKISGILGISQNEIRAAIKDRVDFVVNQKTEITTRGLYRSNTPFFSKFMHALKNKID